MRDRFVVIAVIGSFALSVLIWRSFGGDHRHSVNILNGGTTTVMWSYTDGNEPNNKAYQSFTGILAPGDTATVTCWPADHITFWHDGPGREVIAAGYDIAKIRITLTEGRLVVRGFKAGDTFP